MMRPTARVLVCVVALQLIIALPSSEGTGSARSQQQHPAIPAVPELPITETGRQYHACLLHLAQMTDKSNNATSSATKDLTLTSHLSSQEALQLSQQVTERLPGKLVDDFCEAVHAPGVQEALDARHVDTAAAAARRAAGKAGLQSPPPISAAGIPGAPPKASATPPPSPKPLVPVTPIDYPASGLAGPVKTKYYDDSVTVWTERTDPRVNLGLLSTCVGIEIVNLIVRTVCEYTGTVGAWAGVAVGGWTAPAETVCLAALTATQVLYEACHQPLAYRRFFDDTVDDAETEATYENVRAIMNNQQMLWDKIDITHVNLTQQVEKFQEGMDAWLTAIATENCDLKNRVADAQREVNYMRYLLLTKEEDRPTFGLSLNKCGLSKPGSCLRAPQIPDEVSTDTTQQSTCNVIYGVNDYDLTTKAREIGA